MLEQINECIKQALILQGALGQEHEIDWEADPRVKYCLDDLDLVELAMSIEKSLGCPMLDDARFKKAKNLNEIREHVNNISKTKRGAP